MTGNTLACRHRLPSDRSRQEMTGPDNRMQRTAPGEMKRRR
jgi:hypothetical protein